MENRCSLCNHRLNKYFNFRMKEYYSCDNCSSIQMSPKDFLTQENEANRYRLHNNDVFDINYQNFVKPIVDFVLNNFTEKHLGLDYGCGPGPVAKKLLEDKSYQVKLYDPYFNQNEEALKSKYDYIILSEVVEHFYKPKQEFNNLYNLLKPNGVLIIMTLLFDELTDFSKWHYKNDETHVFFYSQATFSYIKKTFGFEELVFKDRLIILKKA